APDRCPRSGTGPPEVPRATQIVTVWPLAIAEPAAGDWRVILPGGNSSDGSSCRWATNPAWARSFVPSASGYPTTLGTRACAGAEGSVHTCLGSVPAMNCCRWTSSFGVKRLGRQPRLTSTSTCTRSTGGTGKSEAGTPSSALSMNSCQIWVGQVPPETWIRVGRHVGGTTLPPATWYVVCSPPHAAFISTSKSGQPTEPAATRSVPAPPTNQASRHSWAVPVLPNAGRPILPNRAAVPRSITSVSTLVVM